MLIFLLTIQVRVLIMIASIEQGMIEARQSSVASVNTAGTVEAKGAAAEGFRAFPGAGFPGPADNIRRTVAFLRRAVSGCHSLVMNQFIC